MTKKGHFYMLVDTFYEHVIIYTAHTGSESEEGDHFLVLRGCGSKAHH